jgi:hypothetical protein
MRGLQTLAALCLFSTALIAADNPFLGTWKMNVAKSKGTPGTLDKDATVKFEAAGNEIKRTVTGIDPEGQPINISGALPWDGQDHKIDNPDGTSVMVAVKKVNDHTLDVTVKQNGKVLQTVKAVVSKNGKTMTSTIKGQDQKGRKIDNVEVLEKQ